MGSTTAAGSEIGISAALPASQTVAAYEALTFTAIGGVDQIGGFGASTEVIKFQPLKGAVQKRKGPTDYGSLALSAAGDDSDAGQQLLATASVPTNLAEYAVKVTKPDGSLRFFQVLVFGMPETIGAANTMIMVNPVLEINTPILKKAAA